MICFVLLRERTYIQNLFRRLFTKVDPELKRIEGENKPEKHALRMLFNGEIPDPVLWRTKAMQCEGVGLTWVEDLQAFCEARVTDEEFSRAKSDYLINPPQSKEDPEKQSAAVCSHSRPRPAMGGIPSRISRGCASVTVIHQPS